MSGAPGAGALLSSHRGSGCERSGRWCAAELNRARKADECEADDARPTVVRGGVKTESQRAHQDFTPYDGQPKAHVVTSSTSRIVSTFISFHLKKV